MFPKFVDTSLFDFYLPASSIAQLPSQSRDGSRLLLVNRATGQVNDHLFRELPDILDQPVRCFRNTVSVLPARLFGERQGGGKVECLLLRPDASDPAWNWWALLRPAKRLPVGTSFGRPGQFSATVCERAEAGYARLAFSAADYPSVPALANALGEMPLPPYIQRGPDDPRKRIDAERYQTIYADPSQPFAAASPTAGLHFTPEILQRLQSAGSSFHDLNLHVGLGTFRPIQSDTVEEHRMHEEFYEIPASTRKALRSSDGLPKLAIGTTSLRAIEDFFRHDNRFCPPNSSVPNSNAAEGNFARFADIFIYPPANFHCEHLLTNFHLPRSTLLCLVSAFLTPGSTDGIAWLKQIYLAAIRRNFRFYSYGDAMLIL